MNFFHFLIRKDFKTIKCVSNFVNPYNTTPFSNLGDITCLQNSI